MRTSGRRFNKNSTTGTQVIAATGAQTNKIEKTEGDRFLKREQKVTEVSVESEVPLAEEASRPVTRESVDLTTLVTETQDISLNSSRLFEKQLAQQKGTEFL